MNHAFTLLVSGIDTAGNYEDRLYDAGCNDAIVIVLGGNLYLDFNRDASSFEAAVQSARNDVERAGGHVDNVDPLAGAHCRHRCARTWPTPKREGYE